MSYSQHPVALSLERQVGGATRLLAVVMGLPLVDGIFVAMVLTGVLNSVGGILQVGLLVFGGSAMVAVILAELEGGPRETVPRVGALGLGLVALAALEAALAPTLKGLLVLPIFERFAALVLLAVAAKTATAKVGDYLPRPSVIVSLGLLASLDVSGASLVVAVDPELVLRGAAAASVAAAVALGVAALAPTLRGLIDLNRFRIGSAVALGTLPLSILGLLPGNAPLGVFLVAVLLAVDPGGLRGREGAGVDRSAADFEGRTSDERAPWL